MVYYRLLQQKSGIADVAAFGVWIWTTIDHFGDCDNLTTRITILPRVNI
jgi:hypothetical protein